MNVNWSQWLIISLGWWLHRYNRTQLTTNEGKHTGNTELNTLFWGRQLHLHQFYRQSSSHYEDKGHFCRCFWESTATFLAHSDIWHLTCFNVQSRMWLRGRGCVWIPDLTTVTLLQISFRLQGPLNQQTQISCCSHVFRPHPLCEVTARATNGQLSLLQVISVHSQHVA